MREIWKYVMHGWRSEFAMPEGTVPLSVGVQDGEIVIWAEVDPEASSTPRDFEAVNTGDLVPSDRVAFIGTVQVEGIVWHVYEVAA